MTKNTRSGAQSRAHSLVNHTRTTSGLIEETPTIFLLLPALIFPIITMLIVVVGPNPSRLLSTDLSEELIGLQEDRDLFVLIAWWISTTLFALLFIFSRIGKGLLIARAWNQSSTWGVLSLIVFFQMSASLLLFLDLGETGNYSPLSPTTFVLSLILAVYGTKLITGGGDSWRPLSLITAGLTLPLGVVSFWQSPGAVREIGHLPFFLNELLAWNSSNKPLVDFAPQYSSLLGLPIHPLLSFFPNQSAFVSISWLLLLQIICLVLPAIVAASITNRGLFVPSLLLTGISMISVAVDETLVSSIAIFSFVGRHVLPVILLSVIVMPVKSSKLTYSMTVGAISFVVLINNPDFGGTAMVAGMLTLLSFSTNKKDLLNVCHRFFLGFALATSLFVGSFLLIFGEAPQLDLWLLFARVFGGSGFGKEPMAIGGFHVVFASCFSTGVLISLLIRHRARTLRDFRLSQIGKFLMYSATWGLLSMVYFTGRSFTSTLIAGHSLQLALLAVGILSWIYHDKRVADEVLKPRDARSLVSTFVIALPAVILVSMMARLPDLKASTQLIRESSTKLQPLEQSKGTVNQFLNDNPDIPANLVGNGLPYSNLIEIETGVKSVLATNHNSYSTFSDTIVELQCGRIAELGVLYVLEDPTEGVLKDLRCNSVGLTVVSNSNGIRLIKVSPIEVRESK